MNDAYEAGLEKNARQLRGALAAHVPQARRARFPRKVAVIHGETRTPIADFYQRCVRLASALARAGVGTGDTVAVMAPNVPALLEAHYGVADGGRGA
jgi:fatty-acyl-CoA synthase